MGPLKKNKCGCTHHLRTCYRRFQRIFYGVWLDTLGRPAAKVSLFLVLVAVVCVLGLYCVEHDCNGKYSTIFKSLCLVFVLLFSGFDAGEPETDLGWVLAIIIILLGIAVVAVLTADLASHLVRIAMSPWSQKKVRVKGHFLVASWGRNNTQLLSSLADESHGRLKHVVVVDALVEQPPLKDPYVHFIRGNPAADSVLEKAGIKRAAVTIIPIDWRIESDTLKDSVNTLIMLAVEGSNPATYSCVEIMKSSSRKHLRRTAANEVVCVDDLSVRLLTQAALNPGFSFFVESLLTTTAAESSRLHKELLPPVFAGMTFRELFALLNTRIEEILLAVERPSGEGYPKIYANPTGRFELQAGDMLFLLGEGGAGDLNQVAGSYDCVVECELPN